MSNTDEIDDLVMVALESGHRTPRRIAEVTELGKRTVQLAVTRLVHSERAHMSDFMLYPGPRPASRGTGAAA